ncbi:MAG TPA: MGMT family protein [Solirubrobacterales bacterium]|nr:MGMT family protein [Solirubrobacterales bacterium]
MVPGRPAEGARNPVISDDDRHLAIIEAIRSIPEGFVATYGDVSPGAPRLSARLLSTEQHPDDVPWWRVVRADGSLAVGERQRQRLWDEGVPFKGERVDMDVARIPRDP